MKHIIILFAFIFAAAAINAQTVIARPTEMTINAVLDCVPTTISAAQQAEARDNLSSNYYLTISALRQFDDGMDEQAIGCEVGAMKQTKQFDTFDNLQDRKELVILFEKLGEGLPDAMQWAVRAKWLESLIPSSVSGLATAPMKVNPESCRTGALTYILFAQIVGVLGVPIRDAARLLDRFVTAKAWLKHDRCSVVCGS